MISNVLALMFALSLSYLGNTIYVTTCHNDKECGTICGTYGADTVGPSEGMFGITCQCQNKQPPVYKCTKDGIEVKVCSDNLPPSCTTPYCNKPICVKMNGKQATAVIRSACPKYHPVNADQCCKYGGTYCTCIKQQTLDLNYKPYQELGNANGYTTSVTYGACGNGNSGIEVFSQEGQQYLKSLEPSEECLKQE